MKPQYALEGSVFVGGAAVQWVRDGLGIIADSDSVEALARQVPDTAGVQFVPAFTGLGRPIGIRRARGALLGLTRGTSAAHIARATLEAIAFQSTEVPDGHASRLRSYFERTAGGRRVEVAMRCSCSFQADLLGAPVICARHSESTALGAACLAGVGIRMWTLAQVAADWQSRRALRTAHESR